MNPRTTVEDVRELLHTLRKYATEAEAEIEVSGSNGSDDGLDAAPVCGSRVDR